MSFAAKKRRWRAPLRVLSGWLCLSACLAAANIAEADHFFGRSNRPRGPKTLASWNGAPRSHEPEEANPRIITDRPHLAEATTTVGLGRVQIENGYTYFIDGADGTQVQTHSYPETLLRVGMFR